MHACLQGLKKVGVDIVCLQDPYVGEGVRAHPAYEIKWGMVGNQKEQRVVIGIAINIRNRLIVKARTHIIDYPYTQGLDIWE